MSNISKAKLRQAGQACWRCNEPRPEEAVVAVVAAADGAITVVLGARRYRYDRLGLQAISL
jgi:hypothetical protein